MRRFTLFPWVAALTLAIALAPAAASAQEDGTVTISGTFGMDYLNGETDLGYFVPDLLGVYYNGHEHSWTLTLHGTTQSHYSNGPYYATEIHATSFDLEFFGPDADTLNDIVNERLAGEDVSVWLQNTYDDNGGGLAIMHIWVGHLYSEDLYFHSSQDMGVDTLFPTDADGYPVVRPEPFSIETDYTEFGVFSWSSSTGFELRSLAGLVTLEGSVGEPDPEEPVALAVADASVLEGDRGTRKVTVPVTLSNGSSQAITVSYRTVAGTAKEKVDYNATSGTLTFQPGETSRTISVGIVVDRKREANETLSVELSNAVGATINDGVATVTILNDD